MKVHIRIAKKQVLKNKWVIIKKAFVSAASVNTKAAGPVMCPLPSALWCNDFFINDDPVNGHLIESFISLPVVNSLAMEELTAERQETD